MKYNWANMTDDNKRAAVQEELRLVTHMGTTKDDLVEIMRYLAAQLAEAQAELEQLRKVRDAAEKMVKHCDKWLIQGVSTKKEELRQALTEGKEEK